MSNIEKDNFDEMDLSELKALIDSDFERFELPESLKSENLIHLLDDIDIQNDEQAAEAGVKDGEFVSIKIEGERGLVFDNVLVRAGSKHEREVHLDTDEGNAAGCGPDAVCTIIK